MRLGRLTRAAAAVLAIGAAASAWRVWLLPAAHDGASTTAATAVREVRVAYHVHSNRSDGTGTADEIAAAAAAASLDVVILTDHGDGTRVPDAPRRVQGVLVIDAAEISTWAGHYVALGARPAPYPLGGAPDAVVEDVARLGGYGIVAHPGSAKDDLKWRDWDAPFDAIEWLNADSEWRDRPRRLWDAIVTYPWAPVRTLTALLDRPSFELGEWDRHAARRPVTGLAAHDAHARVGLRGLGEPYDGAVALRVPGYAAMFRTLSNVVLVATAEWGASPSRDAAMLVEAVRAGRVYSVVTGRGRARVVHFTASSGGLTAGIGDHLVPAGPVTISAESDVPQNATTALVCDGRTVASQAGSRLSWTTPQPPGACRLEVRADQVISRAPWLVTSPIYVRPERSRPLVQRLAAAVATVPMAGSGTAEAWVAETAAASSAEVTGAAGHPGRLDYTWRLGEAGADQFAAIRTNTPADLPSFDRLVLRASADRPMRVWVQLRTPEDGGHRWGTSVYLDTTPRQVELPFVRMLSIDRRADRQVPIDRVTALLVVVDTVYARAGESGTVTFDEVWLAR